LLELDRGGRHRTLPCWVRLAWALRDTGDAFLAR
jgi:hypothetical protein